MQRAEGSYRDGRLRFAGTSYAADPRHPCPISSGYSVDRLVGEMDRGRNELQARMEDELPTAPTFTVFRRIDCVDPRAPSRVADPPPPKPKQRPRSWLGCG